MTLGRYTGPVGEEAPARDFILKMFMGKNKTQERTVYVLLFVVL